MANRLQGRGAARGVGAPPAERLRAGVGAPRVVKSERGQSTAMVVSMLFVLVLFIAVVVDVGQAVNRRIALQIVADAGAFTGATEMAVGLNNMAYWNKWIQTIWAPVTWATGAFIFSPLPNCELSVAVVDAYKAIRTVLGGFIGVVNLAYMGRPRMEAERISEYNIRDLFPGEWEQGNFEFDEWDLSTEVGIIPPRRNLFPLPTLGQGDSDRGVYALEQVPDGTSANGDLPAWAGSRRSATWGCFCDCLWVVEARSADFNVWYKKSSDEVNYFVWLVTARPTKALMFDSILGPNAIPEMRAVGVAKPVGGSMVDGASEYVAKMVPAAKAMVLSLGGYGGIIDDSYNGSLTGSMRVVTH